MQLRVLGRAGYADTVAAMQPTLGA